MKKHLLFALCALLVAITSCQKSEIDVKINDLDKRVTTLEDKVKELNERTIPGLQAIIAAIQAKLYVTDVTTLDDGYVIVFSDGTKAIIKNGTDGVDGKDGEDGEDGVDGKDGEKGEKGDEPVISAKQDGDQFYWTVDGEYMLDDNGERIPVYAGTPMLRINEGKWEVSYDKGVTWKLVPEMGQGGGGTTISIEDTDTEIIFWINGEKHVVKKEVPFFMVFESRDIAINKGETKYVEYNITGINPTDEVEVDILSCTAGWEADVLSVAQADVPGYIVVTNVDDVDGKIFVYASNGKGKTDIKSLIFEGGVFKATIDAKTIVPTGGEFTFSLTTNLDYEVSVDTYDGSDWLALVPETKSVHTDVITLLAQPNEGGEFRVATVYVTNPDNGAILEEFDAVQYPNEAVTTDLASLALVENGTKVTVHGVKVVASAKNASLIYDGENIVYVSGASLPVGAEIKLEGEKDLLNPDDVTPQIYADKYEVTAESSAIADPEYNYIGIATNYNPARTVTSGVLFSNAAVPNKLYSLVTPMGQTIKIDTPAEDMGLEELLGKLVGIDGYVTKVTWPEDGSPETAQFILESIQDITPTVNPNWTLSYKYLEGEEYPESFINTVSNSDNERYVLNCYSVDDLLSYYGIEGIDDPQFPTAATSMFADDFQFYAYYYLPAFYGITTEEVFEMLAPRGTSYITDSELPYGKYVIIATGVDDNGGATGHYAAIEFEKKEPESIAAYEDFLGKWELGESIIELTQKVAGQSYNVSGLDGQAEVGVTFTATYKDNKLYLSEQYAFGKYQGEDAVLSITGYSESGFGYPMGSATPDALFAGYILDEKKDKITVVPLKNADGATFEEICTILFDAQGSPQSLIGDYLIENMPKVKESSIAYEDYLGQWNFTISGHNHTISFEEYEAGSSYAAIVDDGLTEKGFYGGLPLLVNFSNGGISIKTQKVSETTHATYGHFFIWMLGKYNNGTKLAPITGNYTIAKGALSQDKNKIIFTPSTVTLSSGPVTLAAMGLIGILEGDYEGYILSYTYDDITFDVDYTRAAAGTSSLKKDHSAAQVLDYTNAILCAQVASISSKMTPDDFIKAKQQTSSSKKSEILFHKPVKAEKKLIRK